MSAPLKAGEVFEVPFPFSRTQVELWDDEGPATVDSWKPGVRFENTHDGDSESVADGLGAMILTVVDVHKPGQFPTRVFYTRQWRDPDGKLFGKGGLKITTSQAFRRRAARYMHDYVMAEAP